MFLERSASLSLLYCRSSPTAVKVPQHDVGDKLYLFCPTAPSVYYLLSPTATKLYLYCTVMSHYTDLDAHSSCSGSLELFAIIQVLELLVIIRILDLKIVVIQQIELPLIIQVVKLLVIQVREGLSSIQVSVPLVSIPGCTARVHISNQTYQSHEVATPHLHCTYRV